MKMISIFFLALFMGRAAFADSAPYYADLINKSADASSCLERALFARDNDPFYEWISSSSFVNGFGINDSISVQGAGIAYKKLSAWRVAGQAADGSVNLFSSPEPHVFGGSFHQSGRNLFANMTVYWGVSIRMCASLGTVKGPNSCRYTTQIIATHKDGSKVPTFKALLAEVPYLDPVGGTSNSKYLTNWVSNARTSGAVGENQITVNKIDPNSEKKDDEKHWYYLDPLVSIHSCSREMARFYTADMVAYMRNNSVACGCYSNVCVKTANVSAFGGMFTEGCKESINSFWTPTTDGVRLFSYSNNSDAYYFVSASASFSNNISSSLPFLNPVSDTFYQMYYLVQCLEDWVNSSNPHPDFNEKLYNCSQNQNLSYDLNELIDYTTPSNSTNLIIEYPLDVVYQSVENAVNSGDNCRDLKGEDQVCSSDILSKEQKQQIDNIIANFSHLLEVRDEAQDNWDNMASKLHDIYVDMLTALVAMFTATAVVFSKTVVAAEQLLVGSIMAGLRNIISSKRKVNSEQDEDKPDAAAEEEEDAFYPNSWWVVLSRVIVRLAFLLLVTLKFMFMALDNLKKLDSSPQEGWTGTLHYQQDDMAFLVTTTSTIQLIHRSTTIIISKALLVPYIFFVFLFSCLHLRRNPLLRNYIILPSNYDLLIANYKQSSAKKSP